jgi:predicted  nucleic acid-binding Zn-ribbon protein
MKNNVVSIGLGIIIGVVIGVGLTWYMTNDLATQAVIEAELKFNELLEAEKSKYQNELGALTELKENLEFTLTSTEVTIDSLNTTISTRSKELDKIRKKYAEQMSDIDGMSHNELTNFFAKRYGN